MYTPRNGSQISQCSNKVLLCTNKHNIFSTFYLPTLCTLKSARWCSIYTSTPVLPISKYPSGQRSHNHTLFIIHNSHMFYHSQSTLFPVLLYPHTLYPSQSIPQPSVHVPTHFVPFTKYPSAQCSRTHTLCTLHKVSLSPVFTYQHTLYPSQSTPRYSRSVSLHRFVDRWPRGSRSTCLQLHKDTQWAML